MKVKTKFRDLPDFLQYERIEAECRKRHGYGDDVKFFWDDCLDNEGNRVYQIVPFTKDGTAPPIRVVYIVKQIEEEESLSELEKPFEPYKPKWIPDSCKIHGLQVIY